MIIDVHAHLGWDTVFEDDFTKDELLQSQETNGIDTTIVQPGICHDLRTVQKQHDAIAELACAFPGRFCGMANPNPHLPEKEYSAELRRCTTTLGFVGVKLHPHGHCLSPDSAAGRMVFGLAQELGIPVMIHTGAGIPWALPANILPVARQFPDVRIVMAHAGHMLMASEALTVATYCPNVYLETSWTGGFLVRHFAENLGAHRLLFGSDHADNAATELTKLRTARLSAEQLCWCLGKTAASIYRLKGLPPS
ncbi:MAG: amidohydrolase family protein [Limnochordia bacterium]|jgi:predicted TIM-barrel fold metal-dependent hydrolase